MTVLRAGLKERIVQTVEGLPNHLTDNLQNGDQTWTGYKTTKCRDCQLVMSIGPCDSHMDQSLSTE